MPNRCKIEVIGHLGRDPEPVQIGSSPGVRISVAFTDRARDRTTWYRVVGFGKVGERMQAWLKKGDAVAVWGRHSFVEYTKKDGTQGYSNDIYLDDFMPINKKDATPEEEAVF